MEPISFNKVKEIYVSVLKYKDRVFLYDNIISLKYAVSHDIKNNTTRYYIDHLINNEWVHIEGVVI